MVFYEKDERVGTVPIAPLSRVFLRGDVTITAGLLGSLGESNIGVVILSGRKGTPTLMLGRPHNDAARRMAQFRCSQEALFCLRFSQQLVGKKIGNQIFMLEGLIENHLSCRYALTKGVKVLRGILDQIEQQEALASLRGLEGAAANHYFAALKAVVPNSLGFHGRNRRPPRDPFNAILSLTYTLLHSEAVLAAHGAGLDPYIGFYHLLDFGRESLASDLIEPVRPMVDNFSLRLFNRKILRVEQFSTTDKGCFLSKAGRVHFYRAYEETAETFRKSLSDEIDHIIDVLKEVPLCQNT